MLSLFFSVVIIIIALQTCLSFTESCLHSHHQHNPARKLSTTTNIKEDNQQLQQKNREVRNALPQSSIVEVTNTSYIATGTHPLSIRYLIDFSNLVYNLSDKYCQNVGETRSMAYPGFGDKVCTAADIFTTEKRQIYLQYVLPEVLKLVQGTLVMTSTERAFSESGPLIVSSTACSDSLLVVPESHSTDGISGGVDFVVYLTSYPIDASISGWALACATSSHSGRINVAQINIPPHRLAWSSLNLPSMTWGDRSLVRILLHEYIHALGVDNAYMKSKYLIKEDRSG